MDMKNIFGIVLAVCLFLIGCVGSDPIKRTAQSFIPQLYSGLSFEEYKILKNEYYPPIEGGTIIADRCFVDENGIQQCNGFEIDTATRLSYSFSKQQVAANCEIYQCFPTDLPNILIFNTLSGNTQPVADRIQAGLVEWGARQGGEEVYIFFDDNKSRLVGIMVLGELELEPFQFFRP